MQGAGKINIINLGNSFFNKYIIKTGIGLIVVDTGYSREFNKFIMKLKAAGLRLSDIKFIFLTHSHNDHTGFINEIIESTSAEVILHKNALSYLTQMKGMFANYSIERFLVFESDEQYLEQNGSKAKIISLPGHTNDSIGLLLNDGSLFCGDAAMNCFPSIRHKSLIIEDKLKYAESWDKIIELNPDIIYPTHGKPFTEKELVKYRKYI